MLKLKKKMSGAWAITACALLGSLAFCGLAPALSAQTVSGSSARILVSPARVGASATAGEIVREIDDPHTGARWILMLNPEHPGGPGILEHLEGGPGTLFEGQAAIGTIQPEFRPVIRAGERLIVEEDTAVAEARLEAVALGSAAIGSIFEARLTIGRVVVRVRAIAPGRAELQPQREALR
jgi:hypothetical protein